MRTHVGFFTFEVTDSMIVFCHLLNDNSGNPVVLKSAIDALNQNPEHTELFVSSQGRGCLEATGAEIHSYWYRRSRFRIVTLFKYLISQMHLFWALSLAGLLKDAIICVNTLLPFGATVWDRLTGRKVICHIHEISVTLGALERFLIGIANATAQFAFYVSNDHKARMSDVRLPAYVVPNAIDQRIAEAASDTPCTPRRSSTFNVVMLASPRNYKGIPEFMDAAQRLTPRSDITFTLGMDADQNDRDAYLRAYDVPASVLVHARTAMPEIYYAKADLLMNLSRLDKWIETFSLTSVDAMAFGLPVIVPPVGWASEIVTGPGIGFLVNGRDTDRLAALLQNLAAPPDQTKALSLAARQRAQNYTDDAFRTTLRATVTSTLSVISNQKDLS